MKVSITILFSLFVFSICQAQLDPVKWTFEAEKISDDEYNIVVTADIDNGWSVYSQHIEENTGPVPTSLNIASDVELVGQSKEIGLKHEAYDENFGMKLIKYSRKAKFSQRVKLGSDTTSVSGHLTYMTCDSDSCLPPTDIDFVIALTD